MATSLPALERNFLAHVKDHESEYFVMVIQARNTHGPPGTLYAPTPLTTALAVVTFNHFALENDIDFHAFFTNESKQAGDDKHKKEIEQQFEPGIKKVFERSVAIRDNNEEVQQREKESWNALAHAYPRVKLNKIDLTFIDGEEVERTGQARSRPINDLATPKKYLKRIPENWRVLVTNAVNYLLSKKRDRTEKATTRAKTAIDKFSTSMIRREKSRDDLAAKAVAAIVGRYPLDETHDIIITDDPISMFAKSTGQDWEEESCEKDGGSHNAGVYSDIEIGNCVAFIVEKENDHPIARIMVRWCDEKNAKTKKIGFGIERRWYYTTSPGKGAKIENTSKNLMYKDMPFVKATASVVKILKEKNVYDYKQCVTPYSYGGYSDVMQTAHVRIEYKNLLDTNKVLFSR
nr:hypothetical protein [Candidatus Sigynarchaeota archaeon]